MLEKNMAQTPRPASEDDLFRAGYFTMLKYLLYQSPAQLEIKLGYSSGTLGNGWVLLSPRMPLAPHNIDLRGSTRWPEGKLPDGREIGSILSTRLDLSDAQIKVVNYFDRGLDNRPVKVLSNLKPSGYPAATPSGIPQFKLRDPVWWVVLANISPGSVLDHSAITF